MRRFFLTCAALLVGGTAAFGYTNILENETSQTITNGWDAAGDMFIGDATPSNALIIAAGGSLTNVNAFVGAQAGASDNTATVSGADAEWINTGTLQVGAAGNSNNVVSVSDGGTVTASNLVVFADNAFNLNTNGTLEVTDGFDAGQGGFNWNDGGSLSVGGSLSGMAATNINDASYNYLDGTSKTLTLNGGEWEAGITNLIIGLEGSGNQLVVTNGGAVGNADAYVGYADTANGNEVVVTGTNSLWSNAGTLTVGSTNNSGNNVAVSDGGKISAAGLMVNSNNTFNLNADGNLDIRGDFNAGQGGFNWADDGLLSVGGSLTGIAELDGIDKSLVIDGGSWTTNNDLTVGLDGSGNSLVVQGGGVVSNANASVGRNAGANSNSVMVTGFNSLWANTGILQVGSADTNAGNVVNVENSGTIAAAGLVIEADNEFNLNSGGTLEISGAFDVDQEGLFNWENDSTLEVGGILDGFNRLDGNEKTLVLDGGSLAIPSGTLEVGYTGSDNTLKVLSGATIQSQNGLIGAAKGSTGNLVSITGTNSSWYVDNQLLVGVLGSGNELKIETHGLVTNASAWVGFGTNGNSVTVSGEGAEWLNGSLFVGAVATNITTEDIGGEIVVTTNIYTTSGNKVTVSNDGFVQADTLVIQDGNEFNLDADGMLRMTGGFSVSQYINSNFTNLNWDAGGNLSVGGALSGITNVTGGRTLTLDGTGATWDLVNTDIMVGGDGDSGSTLVSTNGAIVKAANLRVEGSGNSVNIEDGWLLVGDGATTNTLASGGVMVASTNGAEVVVENFAQLNIAEALHVGLSASETGTVTVADNGILTAGNLVIADANSAFNLNADGTLRMTGDFDADQGGFNWNEGGHLSVGGDLQNLAGLLETNQLLTVGGTNATWVLGANDLVVGQDGSDNQLFIEDGGFVSNLNATVGATSNAWGNAVTVSGSNSVWSNAGRLQIGAVETNGASLNDGNSVTVSDSGTVIANELVIYTNNYFNLDDGGTLRVAGVFDISDYINTNFTTLNWESGGNLYIEGDLTSMAMTNLVVEGRTNSYTYLDGGHIVTIDGTWSGDTNLAIGFNSSNNGLVITNGGAVDNANGFIGWGSGAANNSVLVSGTGSEWLNRENLYVGGYSGSNDWYNAGAGNELVVESNAWVFVGDAGVGDLAPGETNGGIIVASSTGTELIVGRGEVSVDSLYVGANSNLFGRVDVRENGAITLKNLNMASGLGEFNLEGALNVTTNFDAGITGFNWLDDGDITVINGELTNLPEFGGTNKTLTIEGGSWGDAGDLVVGTYGSGNKLTVSSNSLVTSTSGMIGASNAVNNAVTLSSSNSVWQNSGDLTVGYEGSGNSLTIEDGATNNNGNGYIGYVASASKNWVSVAGSNSVWNNTGDLYVGYEGSSSTLTVKDYGHVSVGTNLYVQNSSTLNLASSGSVYVANSMIVSNATVAGAGRVEFGAGVNTFSVYGTNSEISANVLFDGGDGVLDTVEITDNELIVADSLTNRFVGFENLKMTNSLLGGTGTVDVFTSINMFGGWIAPDGELVIDGAFEADETWLQLTAGADSLQMTTNAGVLDLFGLSADVTVSNDAVASTFNEVILTADGGLTGGFATTNFIEHFLLYDFLLTNDLTTVSVVSEAALDDEISSTVAYAGIQGVRAGFNGMQNAAFVRTKQLRRNAVATDQTISHEAYLMSSTNAPAGPRGPGDKNTIFGMHFWAEQFSGQGDYDAMGLSEGFILNNNGTTFGLDKLFGDSLVAGINYTYARSAASATGGDRVETETYWLGLYGEWFGKNDYYLEGLIGLGWSDYDTIRIDPGYKGIGSFEGNDFCGHVEAGKYFHRNNWAMAPYAGLHYLSIKSDSYTETEQVGGNEIAIDGETVASLESALGIKLRNRFDTQVGRFQTVGYAEWAYDFINDDIGSTLSDGTTSVGTARITPGASLLNAGVGLSWVCTDSLEVGVGYDGRFNENYEEHMGSVMLDVRF